MPDRSKVPDLLRIGSTAHDAYTPAKLRAAEQLRVCRTRSEGRLDEIYPITVRSTRHLSLGRNSRHV